MLAIRNPALPAALAHYRRRLHLARAAAVVALLPAACAPAAGSPGGEADPALAARLDSISRPTRRLQVTFDWNLKDREVNFSGRGVLRLDRDQRARVDLFDPRGNTLAAAIIEGEQMRMVPPAASRMLPPPALLWSALGAFRQPTDAPLVATSVSDGATVLDYARDETRWRFRFEGDALRHVEWTAGGGRRTVELRGSSSFGLPAEGTFRDWAEFRELTIRATEIEEVTGFDPDVWILPGER